MRQIAWFVAAVLSAGLAAGCVERRYVVTSDPPGAFVLRNNQPIGAAPADDHFVYYGKYHFTLIKDGYTTLQVDQDIDTPWYQYAPLDFISENLIPWWIRDVRRYQYHLEPLQSVNTDQLLGRATELRDRGKAISPAAAAVESPPPAAPPPPNR
jgi:hypothetical protein